MQRDPVLTTTALLAIALASFHFAADMTRGFEAGDLGDYAGVLMLAAWLFGALALPGQRAGFVLLMLGALLGTVMTLAHMRGAGLGPKFGDTPGGFAYIWSLVALGITSACSFALAARGLWRAWRGGPGFARLS